MEKLFIPITAMTIERKGIDSTIAELRKVNPDIVFLAIGAYSLNTAERKKQLDILEMATKRFQEAGFTVGTWLWSFAFLEKPPYACITSADGNVDNTQACPADEDFLSFMEQYMIDIAKTGTDIILFDDDYRFGHRSGGLACFCQCHLDDVSRRLNETVTRETLVEKVFAGKPNKYRDAWQASKGWSLENFAARARKAVDSVNPNTRMGLCACMTTWDVDGTDCIKISKLLAGDTKPFLRLIGAPYWSSNGDGFGNKLMDTVEFERMQAVWCEGEGIETAAEGDTYPRPRYACSANFLEIFHTALLADGKLEGIHKYMFDYYSSVNYEKGYVRYHLDNQNLRDGITEIFADKEDAGIRIVEHMQKMQNADAVSSNGRKVDLENLVFSPASRFLCQHSIPTNYTSNSRLLTVFGENAKYLTDITEHDYILDTSAAETLQAQGIDTGIVQFKGELSSETKACMSTLELYYPKDNEYCAVNGDVCGQDAQLKEDCQVILWYVWDDQKAPAAYTYCNEAGMKFLVFLFDSRFMQRSAGRNYLYQRTLIEGIGAISREQIPVTCPGNPDLYILTKCKGNKLAVGLWNCFPDKVLYPDVQMPDNVESVKFVNCTGKFQGSTVSIDEIGPYGIAAFEVTLAE